MDIKNIIALYIYPCCSNLFEGSTCSNNNESARMSVSVCKCVPPERVFDFWELKNYMLMEKETHCDNVLYNNFGTINDRG